MTASQPQLPDHVVTGWRDPGLAATLLAEIRRLTAGWSRQLVVMEICGTHTLAISRWGIRALLPPALRLVSGPGCPVCVTDDTEIEEMVALAFCPGVTVATYGDLLKVPGSWGTLAQARSAGADVRMVYSPLEALALAAELGRQMPGQFVVFLAVGFETTAPATALALRQAERLGMHNFLVYCAHKLTPPAMRALLADPESSIDAFLIPGHVSTILGEKAFAFLAEEYGCPSVVAGFEPVDILAGLLSIVGSVDGPSWPSETNHSGGVPNTVQNRVHNTYRRAVRPDGNLVAKDLLRSTFEVTSSNWRGLGRIADSGLVLRPEFARFDARQRLAGELDAARRRMAAVLQRGAANAHRRRAACRCGDVLRGKLSPPECPLFGQVCTPADPAGPCMVSSEGACAAYYQHGTPGTSTGPTTGRTTSSSAGSSTAPARKR